MDELSHARLVFHINGKYIDEGVSIPHWSAKKLITPDTDGDGLTDGEEVLRHSTDPQKSDTDGDGYVDKEELDNDSDPLDSGSIPAYPPTAISLNRNSIEENSAIGTVVGELQATDTCPGDTHTFTLTDPA